MCRHLFLKKGSRKIVNLMLLIKNKLVSSSKSIKHVISHETMWNCMLNQCKLCCLQPNHQWYHRKRSEVPEKSSRFPPELKEMTSGFNAAKRISSVQPQSSRKLTEDSATEEILTQNDSDKLWYDVMFLSIYTADLNVLSEESSTTRPSECRPES